jgi:hypothetical protein
MASSMEINQRVTLSLALQRYVAAADRFEQASREFNEACSQVRTNMQSPMRFVAHIAYQHYIVTSDGEGNFDVDKIESI